jgi:hypothetical protein
MSFVLSVLARVTVFSFGYMLYDRTWFAAAIFGGLTVASISLTAYLQSVAVADPPRSTPVPAGKIRICVAGMKTSSPTTKAHYLADMVARKYPDQFETWYYWDTYAFWKFTAKKFESVPFPAHLKGHSTSPFCWLERGPKNDIEPIGGSDHLSEWVLKNAAIKDAEIREYAKRSWSVLAYFTGSALSHTHTAPATCVS